ncbi:MAG: glycosyltransferase family 4 protein [Xanthomonadaceae bacterium]|nr:glycosyltransferase family 4 protein [Xanthomonadaceae bacterium]
MSRGLMLFHRDFRGYTGGHGKVWDYFNHALAAGWDARVFFSPQSLRDVSNPWLAVPECIEADWQPERADVLFLAGLDWLALPSVRQCDDRPIINLVQHVRHADPGQPLRAFLSRRALRICVSAPVADAISGTGEVCGPVRVIEAALNLPDRSGQLARRGGLVIDALKAPALGLALADALNQKGIAATLIAERVGRSDYLDRLASAEIAVLLPHPTEGFYLPALEAMALGCATVVPDCVGNRAYLQPGINALVPEPNPTALTDAVRRLIRDADLRARLVAAGRATAARFSLSEERRRFRDLLAGLSEIWAA